MLYPWTQYYWLYPCLWYTFAIVVWAPQRVLACRRHTRGLNTNFYFQWFPNKSRVVLSETNGTDRNKPNACAKPLVERQVTFFLLSPAHGPTKLSSTSFYTRPRHIYDNARLDRLLSVIKPLCSCTTVCSTVPRLQPFTWWPTKTFWTSPWGVFLVRFVVLFKSTLKTRSFLSVPNVLPTNSLYCFSGKHSVRGHRRKAQRHIQRSGTRHIIQVSIS